MLMRVLGWKHETFRFVHLLICNGQKKKVLLCKMKYYHRYLSVDREGRGPPWTETPLCGKERAVRILLECILVIFSQASVILSTGGGAYSQGGLLPGGVCSQRGSCSWGGAWWRPPRDGYCCGRYASYWNAFLLVLILWSCRRTS